MIETMWLRCESHGEGMFPNEMNLECKTSDGENFSLFADESFIKQINGEIFLKVTPLEEEADTFVVLLPSDPYELASRIITVSKKQLHGPE